MFTGLIEATAEVLELRQNSEEITTLTITRPGGYEPVYGESIAVNGCCLTVTEFDEQKIHFDANGETMALTNLQYLAKGHKVNLERALAVGARLGGHMVSGHVEGIATIVAIEPTAQGHNYTFRIPPALCRYVIPKGSITLNGVSLTINSLRDHVPAASSSSGSADQLIAEPTTELVTMLIPVTLKDTNLGDLAVGDAVNVETDIVGKYLERFKQLG